MARVLDSPDANGTPGTPVLPGAVDIVGLAKRVSLLSTGPTDTATDATGGNIAEVMATEPNDVVADVDVESVKVDL